MDDAPDPTNALAIRDSRLTGRILLETDARVSAQEDVPTASALVPTCVSAISATSRTAA